MISHLRSALPGAAQQDSVQSVRDPHSALQHLSVHAGVCGCRSVHPGAQRRHPRGDVVKHVVT